MKQFKFYFVLLVALALIATITVSYGQVAMEQQTEEVAAKSLEESLEFVVAKAIEVAETTGEFVVEQAPLLLQEFYAWSIVRNIFLMFLLPITIIFTFVYRYMLSEKESENYSYYFWGKRVDDDQAVSGYIVTIIALLAGAITFVIAAFDITKIIIAPKLYLIDHFVGGC